VLAGSQGVQVDEQACITGAVTAAPVRPYEWATPVISVLGRFSASPQITGCVRGHPWPRLADNRDITAGTMVETAVKTAAAMAFSNEEGP
jgi:hypothetical protein